MRRDEHCWVESLESRQMLAAAAAGVLLADNFTGSVASKKDWYIPAWLSDPGSTYYGRTQIRTSEDIGMPKVKNGALNLALDTYNPTGFSMYGSEIITKKIFSVGTGISITMRAKLDGKIGRGIVGGLFPYMVKPDGNHDEVDFELLSNQVASGANKVGTNIYANEALGVGTFQYVQLPKNGKLTGYHTYQMIIYPDRVIWRIDKQVVRTETKEVPVGPFRLHLNIWAPASDWKEAFSAKLQPVSSPAQNRHFSMSVDQVVVRRVAAQQPPVTPVPFTATDAAISLNKTMSTGQYDNIRADGTVTGTGAGTVSYSWNTEDPDGTARQAGNVLTSVMKNGALSVQDIVVPTNTDADHYVWL